MNSNITVSKEQPFKDDLFERSKQIKNLYQLISGQKNNFVICLNSVYGKGKTTFLKMFEAYILSENEKADNKITPIYYDAWENDFFDSPLISILSSMEEAMVNVDKVKKEDISKGFENIFSNLTEVISLGIVKPKEMLQEMSDTAERNIVKQYRDVKVSQEAVRTFLKGHSNNKNVFFIDELDRCKPTFALDLLELTKHFFNTENYYFILALDKNQLYSTIKKKYGESIDAQGYLKRFIDFDLVMTPIDTKKYFEFKLTKVLGNRYELSIFTIAVCSMLNYVELSLRDIDKLLYYLDLILVDDLPLDYSFEQREEKELRILNQVVLALLLFLRVTKEGQYTILLDCNLQEDELNHIMRLLTFSKDLFTGDNYTFKDFILGIKNSIYNIFNSRLTKEWKTGTLRNKVVSVQNTALDFAYVVKGNVFELEAVRLLQLINNIDLDEVKSDEVK